MTTGRAARRAGDCPHDLARPGRRRRPPARGGGRPRAARRARPRAARGGLRGRRRPGTAAPRSRWPTAVLRGARARRRPARHRRPRPVPGAAGPRGAGAGALPHRRRPVHDRLSASRRGATTTWSSRSTSPSWSPGCGRWSAAGPAPAAAAAGLHLDPASAQPRRAARRRVPLTPTEFRLLARPDRRARRRWCAAASWSGPAGPTARACTTTPSTSTSPGCAASCARSRRRRDQDGPRRRLPVRVRRPRPRGPAACASGWRWPRSLVTAVCSPCSPLVFNVRALARSCAAARTTCCAPAAAAAVATIDVAPDGRLSLRVRDRGAGRSSRPPGSSRAGRRSSGRRATASSSGRSTAWPAWASGPCRPAEPEAVRYFALPVAARAASQVGTVVSSVGLDPYDRVQRPRAGRLAARWRCWSSAARTC